MEPGHIGSIKNWLEPQSIRKIQVFIDFANFCRPFIKNFGAIAGLLTSILKTGPGSKFSRQAKKGILKPTNQDSTSFLTQETKESFHNLKKTFCEELVLQHFYMFKLITLEIDASGETIRRVLCQQTQILTGIPLFIIHARCYQKSKTMRPMMLSYWL